MKKFLSLLLTVALVLSLGAPALAAESTEAWYAEAAKYVADNGIMAPDKGDFNPSGTATRGTVFQAFYNLAGKPEAGKSTFTDLADKDYAAAAAWAETMGLATVPADKLFDGDRLVTRGEISTIIARYADKVAKLAKPEGGMAMKEAPDYSTIGAWALEGMSWCYYSGVITGKSGNLLDPAGNTTRAELAQILLNLSKVGPLYPNAKDVRLLATSDLHGWFVPWDFALDQENKAGSLTYLAARIKQERSENKNVVLVDCGDSVQANYVEYFIDHEKNPMVQAMNYLDYDVWTWGNHEYNFTMARRAKLIAQSEAKILSGNIYLDNGKRYLPATTVVERDGIKLGVIGLTTPLIEQFEAGKDSLDGVKVHNPLDETALAIKDLEAQKVDAIIGVFHMGVDQENNVKGSSVTDIANAFPQLDVIIAGHAHKEVVSTTVNGVLITEPSNYGKLYSSVDLTFIPDGDGYKLVDKASATNKAGTTEDPGMVELMAPYKKELSGYVNTPIGKLTNSDLSGKDTIKGISAGYTESTGIWNLMSAASIYYSKAQATVLNTDYENAGFPVGDVSIKNISSSYSYSGGEITVYKVTGADLKTLLEFSADYFNQTQPGDLTVSYNPARRQSKYSTDNIGGGITYCLDLTQPAGSRVKDLALITGYNKDGTVVLDKDGKPKTTPITDKTEILLGANSYGMDQYTGKGGCLEGKKFTKVSSTADKWGDDGTVRALTVRYITEVLKGKIDGNAFHYDNWYLKTGIDTDSAAYKKAVELINNGTIKLPALENGRTNVKSITVQDVTPYL